MLSHFKKFTYAITFSLCVLGNIETGKTLEGLPPVISDALRGAQPPVDPRGPYGPHRDDYYRDHDWDRHQDRWDGDHHDQGSGHGEWEREHKRHHGWEQGHHYGHHKHHRHHRHHRHHDRDQGPHGHHKHHRHHRHHRHHGWGEGHRHHHHHHHHKHHGKGKGNKWQN